MSGESSSPGDSGSQSELIQGSQLKEGRLKHFKRFAAIVAAGMGLRKGVQPQTEAVVTPPVEPIVHPPV